MRQPHIRNDGVGSALSAKNAAVASRLPVGGLLRERRIQDAAMLRRVLARDQHRAAPLAADRDALQHAQHDEAGRRPDADLRIAGQQTDARRGQPHHHQRDHERGLAADAVAEMPEHDAAERPRGETGPERDEREQRRDTGIHRARKEHLAEHERSGRAVDVEVVPLDRGADERREGGAAGPQLRRGVGIAGGSSMSPCWCVGARLSRAFPGGAASRRRPAALLDVALLDVALLDVALLDVPFRRPAMLTGARRSITSGRVRSSARRRRAVAAGARDRRQGDRAPRAYRRPARAAANGGRRARQLHRRRRAAIRTDLDEQVPVQRMRIVRDVGDRSHRPARHAGRHQVARERLAGMRGKPCFQFGLQLGPVRAAAAVVDEARIARERRHAEMRDEARELPIVADREEDRRGRRTVAVVRRDVRVRVAAAPARAPRRRSSAGADAAATRRSRTARCRSTALARSSRSASASRMPASALRPVTMSTIGRPMRVASPSRSPLTLISPAIAWITAS